MISFSQFLRFDTDILPQFIPFDSNETLISISMEVIVIICTYFNLQTIFGNRKTFDLSCDDYEMQKEL